MYELLSFKVHLITSYFNDDNKLATNATNNTKNITVANILSTSYIVNYYCYCY